MMAAGDKIGVVMDPELDDLKERLLFSSNPNLLDNWYFLDPINQRGKSVYEYPGDGRLTIDRWKNEFKCELTSDGIELSNEVAAWHSFVQEIECPDRLLGLPVTLSFLCKAYSGNPHIYLYRTNADGTGSSSIAYISTHAPREGSDLSP